MPNGGVLPSCFVCEWAQKTDDFGTIRCQRHGITVKLALHTVCSDLAHAGLTRFRQEQLQREGYIYTWIEIQYRTPDYPTLPQYYQELVALAPISTYAAWSDAERQVAEGAVHEQKRQEFEQKYGKPE
jgi:hypothetical protein